MPREEWKVILSKGALSQFGKLDKSAQERIRKRLEALRVLIPARTLKGRRDVWVLRIGNFRALYLIDKTARTRAVFFIGNHKEYEKKYQQMFK